MHRMIALTAALIAFSSSSLWGYCIYNLPGSATIHVNVKGAGNLETDIGPGDSACCNPSTTDCYGNLTEISLVNESSVGCTLPVENHGWITAKLTASPGQVSITCESFPENSPFIEQFLKDQKGREGAAKESDPENSEGEHSGPSEP